MKKGVKKIMKRRRINRKSKGNQKENQKLRMTFGDINHFVTRKSN